MTADELAAELYQRQGFLVVESLYKKEAGDVICGAATTQGSVVTPLIVRGVASRDEFRKQHDIAMSLVGGPLYNSDREKPYIYRVEAAD